MEKHFTILKDLSMKSQRLLTGFLLFALLHSCQTEQRLPERISFNFHIKPILSDKCFACHGPDEAKREAGLALHEETLAFKALKDNENRVAIKPGSLRHSEAYQRIISGDPQVVMPPPESKLTLTEYEVKLIAKWIKQGAEYESHWSFNQPLEPKLPAKVPPAWTKNEVDRFVWKKANDQGLNMSAPADKTTLIRRLSFTLRGLPPSEQEIDVYLKDESPDATVRLIDRFLASPAYGERMAADWLDIARFTDSDGYLDDKHRDFTPWRDWVIKAFNQNMPYDDFVTWQLAGDLLPNATQEQKLATAFNRLHKKNSEAGIVFEEYRVEYVADRTHTFGKALLGMTLECARCHDHKYDPISQKDYYQLFGFFNSTHEIGHAVYGPGQTPGPSLMLTDEEKAQQLAFVDSLVQVSEERVGEIRSALQSGLSKSWPPPLVAPTALHTTINGSKVFSCDFDQGLHQLKLKKPAFLPGVRGNAYVVKEYDNGVLPKGVGWFERTDPFSIDLWLYPDRSYDQAGVFYHCEDRRLGFKGYSLHLDSNRLQFIIAHSYPQNALQVTALQPLPEKAWTHITITYDGSSKADGIRLFINGRDTRVRKDFDNLYRTILFQDNIHTYGFAGFMFGFRDKIIPFTEGRIDQLTIYNRDLSALEVAYLHDRTAVSSLLQTPSNPDSRDLISEYLIEVKDRSLARAKEELRTSWQQANELYSDLPEIMIMGDLANPRPTYVLARGNYGDRGEQVSPATPDRILPFGEQRPTNRLGLADWLFDPAHPLTARVIVNRIWQMHFGNGLVRTPDDFGNQGALPSHPELLDWLALWFQQEANWDLKALHRLLLNTAVFQQSSVISAIHLEKDPDNKWLTRGPRYRLPAEMIRDNALAISGLLVDKIGGPSTFPYQPAGLWDEISNKKWRYKYLQQPGEGLYRRSLYAVWKRTAPPPSMLIFDIADRDVCTVKRRTTNTPMQALVLLNDPQYQEAARVLAGQVLKSSASLEEQVAHLFNRVLGRNPDPEETKATIRFYESEWEQFKAAPEKVADYLKNGEFINDAMAADSSQLAAMGVVANSLMNTAEAYTMK